MLIHAEKASKRKLNLMTYILLGGNWGTRMAIFCELALVKKQYLVINILLKFI